MELDPVLELYGLPPEQFTAARNQVAKALDDGGKAQDSASVKALRKPTIAAWLANRLVRIAPDQIADLTEIGDNLREAHRTGDRTSLKKLTPRRHEMVGRLVEAARDAAAADGRTVTAIVAAHLAATLDAAVVDPAASRMLRSGRLTTGLRHVGFGVVDESGAPVAMIAAVPRRQPAPAKPVRTPARKATPTKARAASRAAKTPQDELTRRKLAELHERMRQVEADYDAAEKERLQAESELDANEHHVADMQTAIERLTDEIERARRELRQAQSRAQKLERALTRAARTAGAARRRRDAQWQRIEAFHG